MNWCRETNEGVELDIKVVPGSSRDRVAGLLGDALKVQVSAAPEKGKANKAVEALLAAALGVRVKDVQIVAGHASPRKTVRVRGVTLANCKASLTGKVG